MKVFVQILGGDAKPFDVADGATLGDVLKLDAKYAAYQASVNGSPENDMAYMLDDHSIVTLSEKVKGAAPRH